MQLLRSLGLSNLIFIFRGRTHSTDIRRGYLDSVPDAKFQRKDWMTEKNRVVPFISPVPTYDPDSRLIDEQDLCDETVNDVLDNIQDCDETFVEKENYFQKPEIPKLESQMSIERLQQKIKVPKSLNK